MKILAICGSPRKGNTEAMLRKILEGAQSKGASVELILLKDKKIEFCDGCLRCDTTKSCHKMDEMAPIYSKLRNADILIFGTPTYFSNVSAMMKNFMDRTCFMYEPPVLKGKKVVAVTVSMGGEEAAKKTIAYIKQFAKEQSMKLIDSIAAKALNAEEIKKDSKTMNECFELGQKLAGKKLGKSFK